MYEEIFPLTLSNSLVCPMGVFELVPTVFGSSPSNLHLGTRGRIEYGRGHSTDSTTFLFHPPLLRNASTHLHSYFLPSISPSSFYLCWWSMIRMQSWWASAGLLPPVHYGVENTQNCLRPNSHRDCIASTAGK